MIGTTLAAAVALLSASVGGQERRPAQFIAKLDEAVEYHRAGNIALRDRRIDEFRVAYSEYAAKNSIRGWAGHPSVFSSFREMGLHEQACLFGVDLAWAGPDDPGVSQAFLDYCKSYRSAGMHFLVFAFPWDPAEEAALKTPRAWSIARAYGKKNGTVGEWYYILADSLVQLGYVEEALYGSDLGVRELQSSDPWIPKLEELAGQCKGQIAKRAAGPAPRTLRDILLSIALDDTATSVRRALALKCLRGYDPMLTAAHGLIEDSDPYSRCIAIEFLGKEAFASIPHLVKCITDDSDPLAAAVARDSLRRAADEIPGGVDRLKEILDLIQRDK
jgi:hypothetical protein